MAAGIDDRLGRRIGLQGRGDDGNGEVRIGRPFRRAGEADNLDPAFLERLGGALFARVADHIVGGQDHNRQVPGLEAEPAHDLDAERMALRRLLRADITAAHLVDRRRHGHVLVHHLDALLGGLLRQREDRRLARMAHHGDAVGMGRDRLAQLLGHLFVGPAGKDVIDLRAGVGGGLSRAVVDDRAEGVAFGAADEEAQVHLAAPFVAQRRGVGRAGRAGRAKKGRAGQNQRGRAAPIRNQAPLHLTPPACFRLYAVVVPAGFDGRR